MLKLKRIKNNKENKMLIEDMIEKRATFIGSIKEYYDKNGHLPADLTKPIDVENFEVFDNDGNLVERVGNLRPAGKFKAINPKVKMLGVGSLTVGSLYGGKKLYDRYKKKKERERYSEKEF